MVDHPLEEMFIIVWRCAMPQTAIRLLPGSTQWAMTSPWALARVWGSMTSPGKLEAAIAAIQSPFAAELFSETGTLVALGLQQGIQWTIGASMAQGF